HAPCPPASPPDCTRFSSHSPTTPVIYTLSLHDALPISSAYGSITQKSLRRWYPPTQVCPVRSAFVFPAQQHCISLAQYDKSNPRSEEHTSELQSRENLVCRLLLEKTNSLPVGARASSTS